MLARSSLAARRCAAPLILGSTPSSTFSTVSGPARSDATFSFRSYAPSALDCFSEAAARLSSLPTPPSALLIFSHGFSAEDLAEASAGAAISPLPPTTQNDPLLLDMSSVFGPALPLIGCTAKSFLYQRNVVPFVAVTALFAPNESLIAAWACPGEGLPANIDFGAALRESPMPRKPHRFLMLSAAAPSRLGVFSRLKRLFPDASVATGCASPAATTAVGIERRRGRTVLFGNGGALSNGFDGGGGGGSAVAELDTVGLTMSDGSTTAFFDDALTASFGDVEFQAGTRGARSMGVDDATWARIFAPERPSASAAAKLLPAPLPAAAAAAESSRSSTLESVESSTQQRAPPVLSDCRIGGALPTTAPALLPLVLLDLPLFPGQKTDFMITDPRYYRLLKELLLTGETLAVCGFPRRVSDWYRSDLEGEAEEEGGGESILSTTTTSVSAAAAIDVEGVTGTAARSSESIAASPRCSVAADSHDTTPTLLLQNVSDSLDPAVTAPVSRDSVSAPTPVHSPVRGTAAATVSTGVTATQQQHHQHHHHNNTRHPPSGRSLLFSPFPRHFNFGASPSASLRWPRAAPHTGSSSSGIGSSGASRVVPSHYRLATEARILRIWSTESGAGTATAAAGRSIMVQVEGVKRMRIADAWVRPHSFGLMLARGEWVFDDGHLDIAAAAEAAAAATSSDTVGGFSAASATVSSSPVSTPPSSTVPSSHAAIATVAAPETSRARVCALADKIRDLWHGTSDEHESLRVLWRQWWSQSGSGAGRGDGVSFSWFDSAVPPLLAYQGEPSHTRAAATHTGAAAGNANTRTISGNTSGGTSVMHAYGPVEPLCAAADGPTSTSVTAPSSAAADGPVHPSPAVTNPAALAVISPAVAALANPAVASPAASLDEGAVAAAEALSWWLADVLPLPGSVKHSYLGMTDTARRLQWQLAFLRSKFRDLQLQCRDVDQLGPVTRDGVIIDDPPHGDDGGGGGMASLSVGIDSERPSRGYR